MNEFKAIYLMGFMGVGKSTFGKKLSNALSVSFTDLDKYIEESEEMSVKDIFALKGEEYFRNCESKILRNLSEGGVISLGGGTPIFNKNLDYILKNGLVLYLKLDAKSIYHRLRQSKTTRPLIEKLNDDELFHFIELSLNEREPFYSRAHITVPALSISTTEVIDRIKGY